MWRKICVEKKWQRWGLKSYWRLRSLACCKNSRLPHLQIRERENPINSSLYKAKKKAKNHFWQLKNPNNRIRAISKYETEKMVIVCCTDLVRCKTWWKNAVEDKKFKSLMGNTYVCISSFVSAGTFFSWALQCMWVETYWTNYPTDKKHLSAVNDIREPMSTLGQRTPNDTGVKCIISWDAMYCIV